jgi:hypothetical protein
VATIKEWENGVVYLADAGVLEQTVMIVTGSDMGKMEKHHPEQPDLAIAACALR